MNEQPISSEATDMLDEYDFCQTRRGLIVPAQPNKTRITIRIDTDILEWFREHVFANGGGSYQARINQALHEHSQHQREDWETTLRRVLREELQQIEQHDEAIQVQPKAEARGFLAGMDGHARRAPAGLLLY
jgi:uncharacterized protein (DUF4415 family)